jgi:tetratricopeptide (TPR) repeat protein
MELTIDQALQQGVAAHKEGKLQDAERLYRAILQAQPNHPDANHNLGVLAVAVGKPLEAIPLFKLALETNPQIEQFWLSYIDALIKLERFDEAKRVLVEGEKADVSIKKLEFLHQQILKSPPNKNNKHTEQGLTLSEKRKRLAREKKRKKRKAQGDSSGAAPSQDQINLLLDYYQAGSLEEAEAVATSLTQQFPKHPFGWKVLGAVFKQTGRLNESLFPMQESVDLSPQDAGAHSNLGVTLKELGRLDDAEASYRKAIALTPDYAGAHSNLGVTLQELSRLDDAEASYRKAIALKPDFAEAHNNLGNALKELGRLDEAEASLRQAIALKPDFAEAHNNLGNALKELGRLDEAEASLRQAIALKPDYAGAHGNLGVTLQELGRLDEAEASLRQAIALKPDYAGAHRNLATMKKFSSEDEQCLQMQALYRDPATSEKNRCHICFALAKAYEDLREFARAFQLYAEGNGLRKKALGYNKATDEQLFESLIANYQQISGAVGPEIVAPELTPIFIVGMPRSGTTLVEQIISSHPLVTGAGELSFVSQFGSSLAVGQAPVYGEALTTFRQQYLNALQKRSEGNAIVTDKMPQNFRFLGLIVKALPEAKIIHVKRDPAAVCWANYTQYFVKDSLGYCYNLDDIRHYHELYQDLMKYWHQALPNRIYDLDYEALTERQEEETRKLIDYLELEWSDACLSPQDNTRSVATASNAQVRQKVYQGSSEKWKRYQPFLNGALDHLSVRNQ